MVTVLGYEDLSKKGYAAHNVYCQFEYEAENFVGIKCEKVYVRNDSFETQFKNIEVGDQVALKVGYKSSRKYCKNTDGSVDYNHWVTIAEPFFQI